MSDDKPHAAQIGAAGVQLVAARMLLHCITPNFPIWDSGYDLTSEYKSVLSRVQVKSQLTKGAARQHLSSYKFSLRRVKSGHVMEKGALKYRQSKHYAADQIDAMVFVNFEDNVAFVMPVTAINLSRSYIVLPPDSIWREAWSVLKSTRQLVARPKSKKENRRHAP